jgi:hypothetical protein
MPAETTNRSGVLDEQAEFNEEPGAPIPKRKAAPAAARRPTSPRGLNPGRKATQAELRRLVVDPAPVAGPCRRLGFCVRNGAQNEGAVTEREVAKPCGPGKNPNPHTSAHRGIATPAGTARVRDDSRSLESR